MAGSRDPADVEHEPVLVSETLSFLAPERGGLFVDCTLGLGGHAELLLGTFPLVEVVGIDRDPVAIDSARSRLQVFGRRFRTLQGDFGDLDELLESLGLDAVAGILADLGVSSMQLDRPDRGFSFRLDGPLDMRMGDSGVTARDIVNGYPEEKLQSIFKEFGEERRARRIARAIVAKRESGAIETTRELQRIVARAQPAPRGGRRSRIDPATRVFQALRIEVNQELTQLRRLLEQGIRRLESDGRIVILSYHSLEDRIVKNVFRDAERGDKDPVTGRSLAESKVLEVLTRKPVRPGEAEVAMNPRSRSARLRAARRL
jgi:16S rRNA (cytosine1402-N4)-methyltransferase